MALTWVCIMDKFKKSAKDFCSHIAIFIKWCAIAAILGIVIGVVGSVFYKLLGLVNDTREANDWLLWCLPLAGVLIVFLYRVCGKSENLSTDLVLLSVRSKEKIPFRMAPLIFVSTLITHLFGGSAGREGAALQLGGSIAQTLGKIIKLDEKDLHMITMCGMSACFSAVFGTPIAAAVFSLEVVSVGIMHYSALVPCAVAASVSAFTAHLFAIEHHWPEVSFVAENSAPVILKVILLGALCAGVSYLFCKALGSTGHFAKKYIKNDYLRALAGGVIIVVLTLLLNTRDYLGAGMPVIQEALSGNVNFEAFILKTVFTAITLAAAFKGGEIVPTFFVGATFGAAIAPFIGLDSSFAAMLSMIAVFCGVTNCPISSMLIGFELFGMNNAVFILIICAVSYMLSGNAGLYNNQKLLYSKFKPEFINDHARH